MTDIDRAVWRKSSWSASTGADCVELAWDGRHVSRLRDSKNPSACIVVDIEPFVQAVKSEY